ncbi:restriction endonuclease [Lacrimispora sp.]|uniref:restriction endonuclease n=1 Tax=Lacrimispora sp. TaxID=2719234 RepID=UPI0028AA88EA|nr:restriction endonuclease [Lacrimispora sp.]
MSNTKSNAFQLENIVADMFNYRGYNVSFNNDSRDYGYDLEASYGIETYFIEVKYSKTETIPGYIIYEAAQKLVTLSDLTDKDNIPVLVVAANLSLNTWKRLDEFERLIVIDISNLIYMLEGLVELKSQLLALLEYSVADLLPVEPKGGLFTNELNHYISEVSKVDTLIESLKQWNLNMNNCV